MIESLDCPFFFVLLPVNTVFPFVRYFYSRHLPFRVKKRFLVGFLLFPSP